MVNRFFNIIALAALIASSLLLESCGRGPVLRVHNAVVTLSPVDSNPSALHFTVRGGPKDVYLLRVFSSSAVRAELHESKIDTNSKMISMEQLSRVKIPADGKVEFAKGGKHAMFWGINRVARKLGEMEVEFTFSTGERILVDAVVREADGSIPDERKKL
ncbi:MAG: copper chaperone PCu(A)C [Sphingorhabdus sp.]